MQLINRKDGRKYSGLTRIAKSDDIQMFVWKQGTSMWRYVVWNLNDGDVCVTGVPHQTKKDAMMLCDGVVKQWDKTANIII